MYESRSNERRVQGSCSMALRSSADRVTQRAQRLNKGSRKETSLNALPQYKTKRQLRDPPFLH